jgi:mitochondrial division protein 1
MTPRFISNAQAISSASSSRPTGLGYPAYPKITFSSSLRRTTSSSLQIIEAIPMLLESPIPDAPTPPAGSASSAYNGGPVSFLRGFQATVPSSEKGKERRRKVRGGVAEGELGPGKLGVKKLGMKARGLLGFEDGKAGSMAGEGADAENEEGGEAGGAVPLTGKERRRRRRERERKGGAGAALGREELVRMEREIAWDRENLVVRKVHTQ